jgi:ubiquinone/menaquinone biosynthesis C-methylase UbiE
MSPDLGVYHVLELQIASDPADTRRVMPAIGRDVERVLDVGCGAGQTLIASALGPHVTAIGIDCDAAAVKLGKEIDGRIRFVCSRGESLPLRSAYFDLVISRVALPYMHTDAALAEMTRVLRPGGRIWLALHPLEQMLDDLAESLRRLQLSRALHRLYVIANGLLSNTTGVEIPSPLTARCETYQTEKGITRRLRRLGYENIKVSKKAFFVVTATKPGKP